MHRTFILSLAILLAARALPAGANCGTCEGDPASASEAKKSESSTASSLEDRVSQLESKLSDTAGSGTAAAGKPLTSKAQGSKAKVTFHTQKQSK